MLDRANAKPLHLQMEEIIREKLRTGVWSPGMRIPSENELSRDFGISRMTARGVITRLVQEEILLRIPGKGTFVAENKITAASLSYAGIREQLEKMGYEVETSLLSTKKVEGNAKICNRFSLPKGTEFYEVQRLRYIKGEPFSLHRSYIPAQLAPGLEQHDLAGEQLCSILSTAYNLSRCHVVETLESAAANREEAKLLHMEKGQPLLLLHDTITDKTGRVFEYASVIFRGEKIKLTLEY